MAFQTKQPSGWQNGPAGGTPLNATGLNDLETRIGTAVAAAAARPYLYSQAVTGSTQTTVIEAELDQLEAAGGGELRLGAGTFLATITARPFVRIRGAGAGKTILKAPNSANTDVIKGKNFATLTGKTKATGDYALGCPEFELADLTIDGNKANQTAGYGVRIWGRAPRFKGEVEIRSCKSGGLWTEFTEVDSFADAAQVLEGSFDSLKIHGCDGHGWTHHGPHDCVVKVCEVWSCTGRPVLIEAGAVDGTSWNGGAVFLLANFYLCGDGLYHSGSQLEVHGGQLTCDSDGVGLELASTTGGAKIGPNVFFGGASASTNKGMIVRGTSHTIKGQVARSGTGVEIDGAINCRIDVFGSDNTTAVNVISEGGPNFVTGLFDVPASAALKAGAALNSGGHYLLKGYGAGGSTSIQQFPSATITAAGWSPVLPPSNGVLIPGGVASPTYGTTVTPSALATWNRVLVTNTTAFTIAAPSNGASRNWPMTIEIVNNSGGTMGAITWNGAYLLAGAFTNPASTKRRTITFGEVNGTWIEIARAAADI